MNRLQKILKSQIFSSNEYEIFRTIGLGGFGKVKAALEKQTNKQVAIKIFKKSQIIQGHQIDHIFNQISVLSQLHYQFIVNFFKFYQDSKHIYLIFQLINGGDLYSYINIFDNFDSNICKFYTGIVILSLQWLHKKNIVYRDLKPQNLLLSKDGYLKMIDFGFSKQINQGRTYTICGTPEYIAPEIILHKGHSMAVDWWALGVLIYQMHTGSTPFEDKDPLRIYKNILMEKVSYPKQFDPDIKSLVSNLLVIDLSKRYGNLKNGVEDIKSHCWFNDFNWIQILKKKIKPPFKPKVKNDKDLSLFQKYPNSICMCKQIQKQYDPFLKW